MVHPARAHDPSTELKVDGEGLPVWDDGRFQPLARLPGPTTAEVCVVGLGGSGLAAVTALVAAGVDVVGIDAGRVAGGAAGRNGGFLLAGTAAFHHDAVASLGRQQAVAWHRATADELDRMLAETPDLIRRTGSLRIAVDEAELDDCRSHWQAMRHDGLAAEVYEGPEGRGLLFPADAAFNPLSRCRLLATRALAAGARLYEDTPALHVTGTQVTTRAGAVTCRRTIVAVDGGLETLVPELVGFRTARLQMAATAPTDELTWPRPVYRRFGMDWIQQSPDGVVALGGGRDVGGSEEWTTDRRPTPVVQSHIDHLVRDFLGVTAPITHRWAAPVGFTDGILPVCSEIEPGVMVVGGYNGSGNLVGAMLGRAVAAIAIGRPSGLAVDLG